MIMKSVSEELTKYRQVLNEAWGTEMHTAKKDKGMFKGKSQEEIRSALSKNKKTAENDRAKGKAEPEGLKKRIKQEEFALRAKHNFGKVSESKEGNECKCGHHVSEHGMGPRGKCKICSDTKCPGFSSNVKESMNLKEGVRIGFEQLLKDMHADVDLFIDGGELSEGLFDALYEYYFDEMPYGVAKGRTGDPHNWIAERFGRDLEHEGLFIGGSAPAPNVMDTTLGEGKSMIGVGYGMAVSKAAKKKAEDKKKKESDKKKKDKVKENYKPGPFSKAGFVTEAKKEGTCDSRGCSKMANHNGKGGNYCSACFDKRKRS